MSKTSVELKIDDLRDEYFEQVLELSHEFNLSVGSEKNLYKILQNTVYYKKVALYQNNFAGFLIARLITTKNPATEIPVSINCEKNSGDSNSEKKFHPEQKTIRAESLRTEAEIHDIAVEKKLQNRKIGGELLAELIREVSKENCGEIWLEVRKSNFQARIFYQNKKFEIVRVRKNYYSAPPEDAFVMRLSLQKYPAGKASE